MFDLELCLNIWDKKRLAEEKKKQKNVFKALKARDLEILPEHKAVLQKNQFGTAEIRKLPPEVLENIKKRAEENRKASKEKL